VDGKPATRAFDKWTENKKPRTKTVHARHSQCDTPRKTRPKQTATVLKIVPRT